MSNQDILYELWISKYKHCDSITLGQIEDFAIENRPH